MGLALTRSILALALLYAIVFANFVCDHTSAGADRTSDKRTLSTAKQTAYHSSTCGGPADDLRRIVMTLVVRILLPLCFAMLLWGLRERSHREGQNSCKRYEACN
jgi:predicted cobalt transporter CbtA